MTTIKATIPDFLANQAADVAEKEQTDNIIAIALSAQISAWRVRDTVEQRASRGKLSDLDGILAAVPNVPPVLGDEKG
jgi:hypothetical protein